LGQWLAAGTAAIGMILWIVGGLIDMRTNYESFNNDLLKNWRMGIDLSNPKAQPWAIPGIILFIGGVLALFFL